MLSIFKKTDPIDAFWKCFQKLAPQIEMAFRAQDRAKAPALIGALQTACAAIDPKLCFEFGQGADGRMEFCVTPEGRLQRFELAEKVVARAPEIEGWRIFAFRRRQALHGVAMRLGESKFAADNLRFVAEFGETSLELVLWFDTEETLSEDTMYAMGCIFIDAAIGEYDAATSIRSLDVQMGVTAGALPLTEFPAAFDAWKAQRPWAM